MRIFLFCFFTLLSHGSFSQTPVFKGSLSNKDYNNIQGLELIDDFVYTTSRHFCQKDSSESVQKACLGIHKFDLGLNLISGLILDTLYPLGTNRMLFDKQLNEILLLAHPHSVLAGRPIVVNEFDLDLNINKTQFLYGDSNAIITVDGVLRHADSYYFSGRELNEYEHSYVVKTDSNYNIIWDRRYATGTEENEVIDLQVTIDNNLIYINRHDDGVGTMANTGLQCMVIDQDGNKLDSLSLADGTEPYPNYQLLQASDGSYYMNTGTSQEPTILLTWSHLVKYNESLDSLIWDLELPFNDIFNGRRYVVNDIVELANNDILLVGNTEDYTPSIFNESIDRIAGHGYAIRISPYGEIVWLRVYRKHHLDNRIPEDEYGKFNIQTLSKAKELEDGRILFGATYSYNWKQEQVIREYGDPIAEAGLMIVNADGCLDHEECQEVIEMDSIIEPRKAWFHIGTRWTYEYITEQEDTTTYSHITYEVSDSIIQDDQVVYLVTNDRGLPTERMIQSDTEVWFWDEPMQDWQLTYDFNVRESYPISYMQDGQIIDTKAVVDTVVFMVFGDWYVLHDDVLRIEGYGQDGEPFTAEIVEYCGRREGGLRWELGQDLSERNYRIGRLRCFEQDGFFYNLSTDSTVDYIDCDSTWQEIKVSTQEPAVLSKLNVYPVPTQDYINVEGLTANTQYQILNSNGQVVSKGKTDGSLIKDIPKGVSILQIWINGSWHNHKLVR